MHKWRSAAVALTLALLFLIANRGAYKGYFSGDDIDNISWTSNSRTVAFLSGVAKPVFFPNNFRPVGHYYFYALGHSIGLKFTPYVAILQAFHLLNAVVLWFVLRRLDLHPLAALCGIVFFLFHTATFDAYWQPMYIFDVLCGTFSLLSLLLFIDRRWILSLICLWLAYKAKEVAVMLPAVFFVYEFLVGQKRWKPLIPFFAVSLCFGLQAVFANSTALGPYKLRFSWAFFRDTVMFYAPYLFGIPAALIGVLILLLFIRDRRLYFGIAAMILLLVPMLLLPGRLYTVYVYVPLIGGAIALAAIVNVRPKYIAPVFAIAWLAFTYAEMREYRKATLAAADERRTYVTELQDHLKSNAAATAYLYDGIPPSLHEYGVSGALYYLTRQPELKLSSVGGKDATDLLKDKNLAVLSWDSVFRKLSVTHRDPSAPYLAYVKVGPGMPIWQFRDGWYPRENYYRWTEAVSWAVVQRPPHARAFELSLNMSPVALAALHTVKVSVSLDGEPLGEHEFNTAGWQKYDWPVQPRPEKAVEVEFRVTPTFHPENDSRTLGVAVGGFGYIQ